jgi:NADP-dependent 3-hydroxy acid dehydrogenase YdfG
MDLILLNDGLYSLVSVTKEMMEGVEILSDINCFDLCDILRLKLTTFVDSLNGYVMNDDSGYFFGCMCN